MRSLVIPDSNGEPDGPVHEGKGHVHTEKWHRCIGHVRTANAKRGTSYDPYGVCTSSIGYAGSINPEHRRQARGYQSPPIAGRSRGPGIRRSRAREATLHENQAKLVAKYGITELAYPSPTSTIRHMGYSPSRKQWYGWSHRAVAGFGIGSRVKSGDVLANDVDPLPGMRKTFPVGYTAKTMDDAKAMAAAFALAVS
jgi:hypothetical protein